MSSLEFQAKAFAQVGPILHVIGQALIIDDDEQIPVRVLADPRVRLIHPIAACMAAVENDFENLAVDFQITAGEAQRILELLEDDAHDAPYFLPLLWRKAGQAGFHGVASQRDTTVAKQKSVG